MFIPRMAGCIPDDLGYWREEGTISLVGRMSDMFKSGGYNVYPREIEDTTGKPPRRRDGRGGWCARSYVIRKLGAPS